MAAGSAAGVATAASSRSRDGSRGLDRSRSRGVGDRSRGGRLDRDLGDRGRRRSGGRGLDLGGLLGSGGRGRSLGRGLRGDRGSFGRRGRRGVGRRLARGGLLDRRVLDRRRGRVVLDRGLLDRRRDRRRLVVDRRRIVDRRGRDRQAVGVAVAVAVVHAVGQAVGVGVRVQRVAAIGLFDRVGDAVAVGVVVAVDATVAVGVVGQCAARDAERRLSGDAVLGLGRLGVVDRRVGAVLGSRRRSGSVAVVVVVEVGLRRTSAWRVVYESFLPLSGADVTRSGVPRRNRRRASRDRPQSRVVAVGGRVRAATATDDHGHGGAAAGAAAREADGDLRRGAAGAGVARAVLDVAAAVRLPARPAWPSPRPGRRRCAPARTSSPSSRPAARRARPGRGFRQRGRWRSCLRGAGLQARRAAVRSCVVSVSDISLNPLPWGGVGKLYAVH